MYCVVCIGIPWPHGEMWFGCGPAPGLYGEAMSMSLRHYRRAKQTPRWWGVSYSDERRYVRSHRPRRASARPSRPCGPSHGQPHAPLHPQRLDSSVGIDSCCVRPDGSTGVRDGTNSAFFCRKVPLTCMLHFSKEHCCWSELFLSVFRLIVTLVFHL